MSLLIRNILSLPFVLLTFLIFSQNITQADKIIQKLCSDKFAGRGYVDRGDSIAADYIASYFDSLGLSSIKNNYKQSFNVSVNNIN